MPAPTYVPGFHNEDAVKKIKYRQLGTTDMIVSHIGIGGASAASIYGDVEEQKAIDVIIEAIKSGINYIDTSPGYGAGRSEEVIGKALRMMPRKAFYIATKVGRYGTHGDFNFSAAKTEESVKTSLQRFGVDCIDLVQVHDLEYAPTISQVLTETLPVLQKFQKEGKIKYIGITGYPLSVLKEVLEKSTVRISTVLSYCRYTLQNQDLKNYLASFEKLNVGVINASITAMSVLTPSGPRQWHPASDDIKKAGREAYQLCKSRGVDIARIATQFSVAAPGVAVHVLGCNDVSILRQNIDAATSEQTPLEKEVTQEVIRLFESVEHRHWESDKK